jgi:hypothetical protein
MSQFIQLTRVPLGSVFGPVLANSIAEASLLPADAIGTIRGGDLGQGSVFKVEATGRMSNRQTAAGTLTLRLKLGAALIWTSGALNVGAGNILRTDVVWRLSIILTCSANGLQTKMFATAIDWPNIAGSDTLHLPSSAPVDSAPFDSTIDRDLDLTAQWSVADVGNSLRLHQFLVL